MSGSLLFSKYWTCACSQFYKLINLAINKLQSRFNGLTRIFFILFCYPSNSKDNWQQSTYTVRKDSFTFVIFTFTITNCSCKQFSYCYTSLLLCILQSGILRTYLVALTILLNYGFSPFVHLFTRNLSFNYSFNTIIQLLGFPNGIPLHKQR